VLEFSLFPMFVCLMCAAANLVLAIFMYTEHHYGVAMLNSFAMGFSLCGMLVVLCKS
jgi:hypothetical protein